MSVLLLVNIMAYNIMKTDCPHCQVKKITCPHGDCLSSQSGEECKRFNFCN